MSIQHDMNGENKKCMFDFNGEVCVYRELPNFSIGYQVMFWLWGDGIGQSLYRGKGKTSNEKC